MTSVIDEFIKQKDVQMIDLKYTDFLGRWRHITIPFSRFDDEIFSEGIGFDASSVGFAGVEKSDLCLIPDPSTTFLDPFYNIKTLSMICNIVEPKTKKAFSKDPRGTAIRAENFMKKTGLADESLWKLELEFYVFDTLTYAHDVNLRYYFGINGENLLKGYKSSLYYKIKGSSYEATPPFDTPYTIRSEIASLIEECGVKVYYHHHEGGSRGQCEIELDELKLIKAADSVMLAKYIIKNVSQKYGKVATFMPKPLFGEPGSGMHMHIHLFKMNEPIFSDNHGYAGLSEIALQFIGGILKHSPALTALVCPSTNSFKRLTPGFEAPVKLFFSAMNRSACIRVPGYAVSPKDRRIEYRVPDATCNIYLAMAAVLMAGLDGIEKKIDPSLEGFGPLDINIYELPDEEKSKIKSLPYSLEEALKSLKNDHDFLLKGEVFTKDLIDYWIELKEKEVLEVMSKPHPIEFVLYHDI